MLYVQTDNFPNCRRSLCSRAGMSALSTAWGSVLLSRPIPGFLHLGKSHSSGNACGGSTWISCLTLALAILKSEVTMGGKEFLSALLLHMEYPQLIFLSCPFLLNNQVKIHGKELESGHRFICDLGSLEL